MRIITLQSAHLGKLDQRISWVRWSSRIKLGLIVSVLVGAATVVWFASQLARYDVAAGSDLDKLGTKIADQQRRVGQDLKAANEFFEDRSSDLLDRITSFLQKQIAKQPASEGGGGMMVYANIDGNTVKDPTQLLTVIRNQINGAPAFNMFTVVFSAQGQRTSVVASRAMWQDLIKILSTQEFMKSGADIEQKISEENKLERQEATLSFELQSIESQSAQRGIGIPTSFDLGITSWPVIVQTNITRLGILIVASFLVAILVPLYRSDLKLAVSYQGQKDALLLLGESATIGEIDRLAKCLTPKMEFGKSPTTPVEQIIELVRTIPRGSVAQKEND